MKRKGLYVLATATMLALTAGCGSNQGEENLNNQVTEAVSPAVTTEAIVTPEPTATPTPTATPAPANYMEANGIEVLGAGWHTSKNYIWSLEEFDEKGNPVNFDLAEYESMVEMWEEDNGDGTKTITAALNRRPYIDATGTWWLNRMSGFVDLQSGKTFLPMEPNMEQTTILKRDDKNYELQLTVSNYAQSSTNPYYTEYYTLVCPSDYEDAGFYYTGYKDFEAVSERAGLWKKLEYIRHEEADMQVFGVNQVLATMEEADWRDTPLPEPEGNYFEEKGYEVKGEGKHTWLGTEYLDRLNHETGEWEFVSMDIKEVETEFFVTEELLGDGTKMIKGTFLGKVETSEAERRGMVCLCGIVDKKTGLVYPEQIPFLAEPHIMEKNGEEISILVSAEMASEFTDEGKLGLTIMLICPEDYDDAVFFFTGDPEYTEIDYSEKAEPYSLRELEDNGTDLVFFR